MHFVDLLPLFTSRQFSWRPIGIPAQRPISDKVNCGGSNEYPQSMFLSRNKKNNVYRCKPQFYYIKVGFKGVKII